MNILIATGVYYPDIGGPATYARTLAEGLAPANTVTVISYSSTVPYMPKPFRQMVYLARVWRAAKYADTVYALSTMGVGLSAALAARWREKRFVVRVAGDRVWEDAVNAKKTALLINDFQHAPRQGWLRRRQDIQAWVCRQAIAVVVPSQYLAELVKGWGIDKEKITVVHNSVDVAVQPLSQEEARKKIGIPGKLIVSIGRLVPWKGFTLLIKLMPKLLELNPFFRLVIVGDGPDRGRIAAMIKNMGLSQRVFVVGKQDPAGVLLYLAAAEFFILNSGYEGFSHQILEAMAAGVPVITTFAGGNREVIRQGENGFMVKYNDEFNLLEALKTLSEDEELRGHFIEQGRATAREYTPERTIRETRDVLEHA
jgi:glycosyltransferase involved in cell wall biosynthesis